MSFWESLLVTVQVYYMVTSTISIKVLEKSFPSVPWCFRSIKSRMNDSQSHSKNCTVLLPGNWTVSLFVMTQKTWILLWELYLNDGLSKSFIHLEFSENSNRSIFIYFFTNVKWLCFVYSNTGNMLWCFSKIWKQNMFFSFFLFADLCCINQNWVILFF